MVINVYSPYFEAEASFSGVERRGALVLLISDSEAGTISYRAAVSFFPHRDEEDFAVSYDAYFEKVLFSAAGRRSWKRCPQEIRGSPDTAAQARPPGAP